MFDPHLNFLLLAKIERRFVIASQISGDTAEPLNVPPPAHRAGISDLICIAAVHAGVIRHIHRKIRNIMIHGIVDYGFQSIQVVLAGGIQLYISDTAGTGKACELGFNVNLFKRINLYPNRNMDAVGEELFIGYIGN